MEYKIAEIIKEAEKNYLSGTTTIGKYVEFDLHETVEKIYAYLYSKHTSGDTDSMGREKPFFNIVTAAVNIWYRATDIDRKNVRIKATKAKDVVPSFIATIALQEWMRKTNFGVFLNEWGRTLAKFGSSVVKFVEKDGILYPSVIAWNRIICDPIDFDSNVKIEKLYLTASQLQENPAYDKKMVKILLDNKTTRKTLSDNQVDERSDFIEVYELHGNLPLSYVTENEKDEDIYTQQVHIVSFYGSSKNQECAVLYKGKESKDPYMITHLIKEDGRVLGIGAVEHLFEAQWMMNHSQKLIKDQLDLASKLIFQTSDGNFAGRNALTAIESGDILIHAINEPITQANNASHDITSLQNFGTQWKTLAQEITSTPEALMGSTQPSGTAWRQVEALQQEAHSLFEIMTENKGLAIEEMMRTHVIPHFKKTLNTSEEISAVLESHDIARLDSMWLNKKATEEVNKKYLKKILELDTTISPEQLQADIQAEKQKLGQELASAGNQRFIKPSEIDDKTWKEIFKDLEWEVEVEVTGESSDKQSTLTTLTTVLKTIGANPGVLQNPQMKFLFNKILESTGTISPIELEQVSNQQSNPQQVTQSPGGGASELAAVGGEITTNQQ